jgi:cytochrome c2
MISHGRRAQKDGWLAALLLLCLLAPTAHASLPAMNYLLNCQGCHKADGSGQPGYVPDFRGSVARFLTLPEGRAYLGRVPGTAQSLLSDSDRAEVLNWIVAKFDPTHVPATFVPYISAELAVYRREPLSRAGAERLRLIARLADDSRLFMMTSYREPAASSAGSSPAPSLSAGSSAPPPQFVLCAACHPISSDGASAMGPNLRGVLGRRAGTLPGFAYSAAMKSSTIVWTRETLDDYLTNVQNKVPGTMMTLPGVPDSGDRAAVIAYLETLH